MGKSVPKISVEDYLNERGIYFQLLDFYHEFEVNYYIRFRDMINQFEEIKNIEELTNMGKYVVSFKLLDWMFCVTFPIDIKNKKIKSEWYMIYRDLSDWKEKTKKIYEYQIYDGEWNTEVRYRKYIGKIVEGIIENMAVIY